MKWPKVQIIIDHLKSIDNSDKSLLGFDMNVTWDRRGSTRHKCGSACCIGGHASYLRALKGHNVAGISEDLSRLCEIPIDDTEKICWPRANGCRGIDYQQTTLEQAISVLENYRDTGVVDWSGVEKEQKG